MACLSGPPRQLAWQGGGQSHFIDEGVVLHTKMAKTIQLLLRMLGFDNRQTQSPPACLPSWHIAECDKSWHHASPIIGEAEMEKGRGHRVPGVSFNSCPDHC